ncbi:MAG: porin [Thiobacillaceae bacterium]
MQKKLIALALASAFAAPAFAATSNVDIYGIVNMSLNSVTSNTGADRSLSLVSNVSRLGFKGSEDLGGGLAAIWQLEANLQPDNQIGYTTLRDSFVGLKSNFGTVLAGTHDTPLKMLGRSVDNFGDTMADSRNILGANAFGPGIQGASIFDIRSKNTIAYVTPDFSGLSAVLAYVTDHQAAVATKCALASGLDCNKNDAWSGLVQYANGPIYLGGGYEKHNVVSGFAGSNHDIWRLVGSYTLGDFKLGAQYDHQDDNLSPHVFKRDGYGVFGNYTLGNIVLKANYLKANKIDGTPSSDADQWTLGADYNLSKRSTVYAYYAKVNNSANSAYGLGGGAGTSNSTYGHFNADPDTFGIGLKHAF